MATMREADTALWLHNKLFNDDMWSGTNISSFLTKEILRNTHDCFHTLDSQVKIKLLMSFLYIPRRNAEQMCQELNEILELGCNDNDEWIRILSEILRTFPDSGNLNTDLENVSSIFSEIVQDLRETMTHNKNTSNLLPLECPYLNRGALIASMGLQPAPPKHFTLRRKPKSAALRAELFQKDSSTALKRSHSLASGVSSSSGSSRRPDLTLKSPLKQASSRLPIHKSTPLLQRGLSAATLKQQNRTAKLLDINEQPIGGSVREAKRRKKLLAEAEASEDEKKKKEVGKEQTTPEYAIGLTTPTPPTSSAVSTTTTPSYASMAGLTRFTSPPTAKPDVPPPLGAPPLSTSFVNFSQELQMHIDRESENMSRRAASMDGQQSFTGATPNVFKPTSVSLQHPPSSVPTPTQPRYTAATQNTPSAPASTPAAPAPVKKDLKLTREQMLAAQDMFRGANKVTKPEKALILGFMAGARENPFPNQGDVITIKLSEHTEVSNDTSQTQLVEMLFEMNYNTGHWRRLKRTRVLARQQPTVE